MSTDYFHQCGWCHELVSVDDVYTGFSDYHELPNGDVVVSLATFCSRYCARKGTDLALRTVVES